MLTAKQEMHSIILVSIEQGFKFTTKELGCIFRVLKKDFLGLREKIIYL